jgi:hypothetical protein
MLLKEHNCASATTASVTEDGEIENCSNHDPGIVG